MVDESYAAVSTRRIAQEIGINAATVHYYYPTTDDLFIALHKRMQDRHLVEMEGVLAADDPLNAFWRYQSNWDQSALGVEFLSLSIHRKAVGTVISGIADETRAVQGRIFERALAEAGMEPTVISPIALATISIAIARTLANEERVGITRGHAEVRQFVDWALNHLLKPMPKE